MNNFNINKLYKKMFSFNVNKHISNKNSGKRSGNERRQEKGEGKQKRSTCDTCMCQFFLMNVFIMYPNIY